MRYQGVAAKAAPAKSGLRGALSSFGAVGSRRGERSGRLPLLTLLVVAVDSVAPRSRLVCSDAAVQEVIAEILIRLARPDQLVVFAAFARMADGYAHMPHCSPRTSNVSPKDGRTPTCVSKVDCCVLLSGMAPMGDNGHDP